MGNSSLCFPNHGRSIAVYHFPPNNNVATGEDVITHGLGQPNSLGNEAEECKILG